MLETQRYLLSGKTLSDLADHHAVKATPSEDGRVVSLKYDQLRSKVSPITRECRGLVLEVGSWEVAARPFDRFFNAGEGHADRLTGPITAQAKLDGALAILYRHRGQWRVASSGTPTGSGQIAPGGPLFRDAFWQVWAAESYALPDPAEGDGPEGRTLLFELCVPENRSVCRSDRPALTLIGVRARSGEEHSPQLYRDRFRAVQEFPLAPHEITASFLAMNPLRQEGYVLSQPRPGPQGFARVKQKHPAWVALHHLQGAPGLTPAAAADIVRCGEIGEVIATIPRFAPALTDAQARFDQLLADLAREQADLAPLREDRRAFALRAQAGRLPAVHFALLTGKARDLREALLAAPPEALVKAMWPKGSEPG